MSGPPNVGMTLTEGIQDIAALLPLLGTEQCEKHVGSALEGGYLYAAATPLSIFGSLGIVKLGITVLISCISIPKPSFYFKLTPYPKFSVKFHGRCWLGASMLDNAGFKPVGTVAPLITMDGTRYTAETRLMEILKEKHIEDLEGLSVEWKSTEWNIMLVVCTVVAAVCSIIPYVALISSPFKPSVVYSPWIFPLLRIVGGCLAAVCCQFLIQSRVISLMKNRIIFMIMNRMIADNLKSKNKENTNPDLDIHGQNVFLWDERLPSEECLWNLEQYLHSQPSNTYPSDGSGNLSTSPLIEPSGTEERRDDSRDVSIHMDFSKLEAMRNKLRDNLNEHIYTSSFNNAFIFISWAILFLSLPATVAGYIGCFTLVSGSRGNGPLIWLLLEAALSIIRILLWAWNPRFDERTEIAVRLKLTDHQPLVTTEKDVETDKNTLALVPERQFLEWITSYTGPLEQFQSSENLTLYFTLTGKQAGWKHLYLTVFDINKRNAVTLHQKEDGFDYIDTVVTYNNISSEMQATLHSAIGKDHPWRRNHAILFDALSHYYFSIIGALNRSCLQSTNPNKPRSNQLHMMSRILTHLFRSPANVNVPNHLQSVKTAVLPRKWNLFPKDAKSNDQIPATIRKPLSLTEHDKLYLQRGYEHHLKTKLVENWCTWIAMNMAYIRKDAQKDCHYALTDQTCTKAKWELTELDLQVAFEWTRREWSLVASSFELEGILQRRMGKCINEFVEVRQNEPLGEWMWSEFVIGRKKRLEKEREQTKKRMEKQMKVSVERAEAEGRAWRDQQDFSPERMWDAGQKFIDEQWEAAIDNRALAKASDLDQLVKKNTPRSQSQPKEDNMRKARRIFVELVRDRFEHWQHQRRNETDEMDTTIKHISDADSKHLDNAYRYPMSDMGVTHRFVLLWQSRLVAKFCSATVYDALGCDKDTIHNVIQKKTTRSVINVPSDLVNSIPETDHLLYLSSEPFGEKEPSFIQKNREQWWDHQKSNSSMFYFSPQGVVTEHVTGLGLAIAHIFIYLQTRSHIRMRLLHLRCDSVSVFVSIQERGNELRLISTNEIPEQLRLQDFELGWFEPGRHELQLVVTTESGYYGIRDILVEFSEDPLSKDRKNSAMSWNTVDSRSGERQDVDVGRGENASNLPDIFTLLDSY